MTPEEHGRVRDLYEQARYLTAGARSAFLDQECIGQSMMRQEVDRLLQAQERIPSWLDQPALAESPGFVGMLPRLEGRQISGYTLLREVGRGGMGCVYLAERSDGAFRKQAAIKVLLPSANPAAMLARFQHEREILASLDHPNIARLIDGGSTDEGWPYFVMEYVEGQPIHRWCDDRRLDISQRLALFRGVMEAVRYAHERQVVHRDLKPANILVTGDGAVKVLDFGIAKLLAVDAERVPETVTLAAMMTPEYASPEQVNGARITTRSDVYSLGVVLYELLTGHRPYRLLSAAVHEMARVIAEMEPPRPSEIVATTEPGSGRDGIEVTPGRVSELREGDPNRLRKRLAGDLDAILLMALRKEPERRYDSIGALASDVERHLEHRPVSARPSTAWYRVRRFWQRNPGVAVAGALIAIPVLAGLAAVTLQTRQQLVSATSGAAQSTPLLLVGGSIMLVFLGVAICMIQPTRLGLIAAAVGGAAWTAFAIVKVWTSHSLGWWRSRVPDGSDPLQPLGPYIWIPVVVGLTVGTLILSWIQSRFGLRWALTFLAAASFYEVIRERIWLSTILPFQEFSPGWVPILAEASIFGAGGLVALSLTRWILRKF